MGKDKATVPDARRPRVAVVLVFGIIGLTMNRSHPISWFNAAIALLLSVHTTRAGEVVDLNVLPKSVHIGGLNRYQQLLVTAVDSAGRELDVTRKCKLEAEDGTKRRQSNEIANCADHLFRALGKLVCRRSTDVYWAR